jgi:hypothetical protein
LIINSGAILLISSIYHLEANPQSSAMAPLW